MKSLLIQFFTINSIILLNCLTKPKYAIIGMEITGDPKVSCLNGNILYYPDKNKTQFPLEV